MLDALLREGAAWDVCQVLRDLKNADTEQLQALTSAVMHERYASLYVFMYVCLCSCLGSGHAAAQSADKPCHGSEAYIYMCVRVCIYICLHLSSTRLQCGPPSSQKLSSMWPVCMYVCMYLRMQAYMMHAYQRQISLGKPFRNESEVAHAHTSHMTYMLSNSCEELRVTWTGGKNCRQLSISRGKSALQRCG